MKPLAEHLMEQVPGSAISADQACRKADLTVDICEDVEPLPEADVMGQNFDGHKVH